MANDGDAHDELQAIFAIIMVASSAIMLANVCHFMYLYYYDQFVTISDYQLSPLTILSSTLVE